MHEQKKTERQWLYKKKTIKKNKPDQQNPCDNARSTKKMLIADRPRRPGQEKKTLAKSTRTIMIHGNDPHPRRSNLHESPLPNRTTFTKRGGGGGQEPPMHAHGRPPGRRAADTEIMIGLILHPEPKRPRRRAGKKTLQGPLRVLEKQSRRPRLTQEPWKMGKRHGAREGSGAAKKTCAKSFF